MMKDRNVLSQRVIQLLVVLFIVHSSFDSIGQKTKDIPVGAVAGSQKYFLGVKGGVSVTWPGFTDKSAKESFDRGYKPGFGVGVMVGFPLIDRYVLILEAGASQRGRIITYGPSNSYKHDMTMQMADVGMMLRRSFRFMLFKSTPSEIFVNVGPEINYWFRSTGFLQYLDGQKYKYDVFFDKEGEVTKDQMNIVGANQWLFSLDIGVGMKAPISKTRYITTEVRFASGHTSLGKSTHWGRVILEDQNSMRTNLKTLSVSVAYTLDFDVKENRKGKSNIKKKMKR